MRKIPRFFACFVLTLLIIACSRKNNDMGNNCITRYSGITPSFWITAAQLDTIDRLCGKSNLDPASYQFTSYYRQPVDVRSYTGADIVVTANSYINGLPVFLQSILFNFDTTGNLLAPPSGGWTGPAPDKNAGTRRTLQSLRSIFLNNYKKCTIQGGLANTPPYHPTAPYQDSCLGAMLGYIGANIADSVIPYGTQLVKAWVICAADKIPFNLSAPPFPSVIVIDSTAKPFPQNMYYP